MIERVVVVVVVVVACLAGCAPSVIRGTGYERGCQTNGDCVIVHGGDACTALTDLEVINVAELERYQSDVDAALAACPPWSGRSCGNDYFVPLPATAPTCVEQRCTRLVGGPACRFDDGFCHGVDVDQP